MQKNDLKKFILDYYIYIIIFIIFLIIGIFVPTGGDDWEISSWYRNDGLFRLFGESIRLWEFFNGRILNNFFDMFLSKYPLLWAFISSIVHTLTIYIGLKLFKVEKDKKSILIFLISVLSVSLGIRQEIQIHKIGNISYSIPALTIFTCIYLLLNKDRSSISTFDKVIIFMISLSACLWIENLTLAITVISILIFAYNLIKEKKIDRYSLLSILGCLAGCLILFSSPGFLNRYNMETGDYTTIQLIEMNLPKILFDITLNEKLIILIYSIVCFIMLKQIKKYKILKLYYLFLIIYLSSYTLLEIFSEFGFVTISNLYLKFYNHFVNTNSIFTILIIMSILIAIFISILLLSTNKKDKEKLVFLYLLAMISVGPMVLSPGERNLIILVYVLFIITAYMMSKITIKQKNIYVFLVIVALFRIEDYHYILSNAHNIELERLRIIENFKNNYSKENNTLILPTYDKVIFGNLNSNYYDEAFKKYYFLDKDSIIVYKDDYSFKEILINRNELQVILLNDGNFVYEIKIFDNNNKVLFENISDENIIKYNFKSGKVYNVQVKITNGTDNYKIVNKKVEVKYE